VSCCDKRNGYSHYIACGQFLDQLSDYGLFKSYQFRNPYLFARMGSVCVCVCVCVCLFFFFCFLFLSLSDLLNEYLQRGLSWTDPSFVESEANKI
jgi:hypothetical protein